MAGQVAMMFGHTPYWLLYRYQFSWMEIFMTAEWTLKITNISTPQNNLSYSIKRVYFHTFQAQP